MAECNPTSERIRKVVDSVTFCLRTDAGEVMELPPVLQESFRGELAQLLRASFSKTPRPEGSA